jgi:hypothetical protein
MTETAPTTLTGIAAILSAIAWPLVAVAFFLIYRTKLISIIDILTVKLREAKHVKAGQLEIDTEQQIGQVLNETSAAAGGQVITREIPEGQIHAAELVGDRLNAAPISLSQKLDIVHKQIYELVQEYDDTRQNMPSGPARTRQMNEIAAKMRALSIVAYPLLRFLTAGKKPGERLAAICILQVRPELGYFDWLIERVMKEDQAFILFHASLAILELVRTYSYLRPDIAAEAIRNALDRVTRFSGGKPDQNTIDVLNEALSRLTRTERAN